MVASAAYDPIIVEPNLTLERFAELIYRRRESAKLDYKAGYTGSQEERVELTKDLVAMANTAGGYIVVGIENDGKPCGLTSAQLAALDEAKLRGQVVSYLGTSIDMFVDAPVTFDGLQYGVVTVLRSALSPLVFVKDGQYSTPKGLRQVFRSGDVFVRHGSASERWNQNDVQVLLARAVERERERWLREVLPDVRQLMAALLGDRPVQAAPVDARTHLHEDAETFERTLRDLFRRHT